MKVKKENKQLTIFDFCKDVKLKNLPIKQKKENIPLIIDGINLRGKNFEHLFTRYDGDLINVIKLFELVNGKKITVYKCRNEVLKKEFKFYKAKGLYRYLTNIN